MAYNANPPQQKYVASAGQTVFPFLFKIFQESDLTVYDVAPGDDPEEATPLTLNVDYTVIINGDLGGSITLTVGALDGALITIYRRLNITRYVEYQTSGDLLANTLNNDQDYQTYLVADLADSVLEELSGAGPGTPVSDAVKKTGDTMTGHLNLPPGATGANAIRADEVATPTDEDNTWTGINTFTQPVVSENICTAWANYDGISPAIMDSFNIQSITAINTTQWEVVFTEPMDVDTYSVAFGGGVVDGGSGVWRVSVFVQQDQNANDKQHKTINGFTISMFSSDGLAPSSVRRIDFMVIGGKN